MKLGWERKSRLQVVDEIGQPMAMSLMQQSMEAMKKFLRDKIIPQKSHAVDLESLAASWAYKKSNT